MMYDNSPKHTTIYVAKPTTTNYALYIECHDPGGVRGASYYLIEIQSGGQVGYIKGYRVYMLNHGAFKTRTVEHEHKC